LTLIDDIRRGLAALGYKLDGSRFEVALPRERMQRLELAERDGVARLSTVVASAGAASRLDAGPLQLLFQNRYTELVQFGVDGRGRWIAETVLPPGAVTTAEIGLYVNALATAADRLEQVVSGRDVY
jgi:hypothetical protein